MFRSGTAILIGLALILVEAYIVMEFKGGSVINLGTNGQFITVWIINSLLVFAILTDINNWLSSRENTKLQHDL